MKDLESLYEQVLNEKAESTGFEKEKNVNDDVHPKDSGPEKVDGIEKPVEKSEQKKTVKESPEAENTSKTVKTTSSGINTRMSDKNIFDKLYSTIMEADDELGDALDIGFGDEGGSDEMGDSLGGEEVTITLTQDQVSVLKDVLSQLEGDEDAGEEIEDMEGEDDGGFEEENPFPEAVEAQHTSDGAHPGHDPSGLTGKNNKVSGAASKVTSGGADAGTSGQEDGGKPKPATDTVGKMTSRSNKVDGRIKGGNQDLLG
jgi:hypothetical protein